MTEPTTLPATPEEAPLPVVVPAKPETVAVIVTRASVLHEQVEALAITDEAGLETAAELLAAVKAFRREVFTDLGEPAAAARKLWDMIRERFTKHDDPLKDDEVAIKDKVKAFHRKLALERQQAIDAAESQRQAADTEDDAKLAEAEQLEAAGDHEGAEAVLAEPRTTAPARMTSPPKTKGMSIRENWKAEIVSIKSLIEAAASGDSVAFGILAHEKVSKAAASVASQVAKGMKANMNVPGVRAYDDGIVSGGKR